MPQHDRHSFPWETIENLRGGSKLPTILLKGNPHERIAMKQHRFWAYAMIVCALMCVYTGKKHI